MLSENDRRNIIQLVEDFIFGFCVPHMQSMMRKIDEEVCFTVKGLVLSFIFIIIIIIIIICLL